MIDLKQMHFNMGVRRHKDVPYMWRSRCCCGEYFLAATEEHARMAIEHHIASEEPFPDMNMDPNHYHEAKLLPVPK